MPQAVQVISLPLPEQESQSGMRDEQVRHWLSFKKKLVAQAMQDAVAVDLSSQVWQLGTATPQVTHWLALRKNVGSHPPQAGGFEKSS